LSAAADNETQNTTHQTPNTKHQLSTATSSEVKSVFTAVTWNIEKQLRGLEDIKDRGRELVDHLKITEREAKDVVEEQKERKK